MNKYNNSYYVLLCFERDVSVRILNYIYKGIVYNQKRLLIVLECTNIISTVYTEYCTYIIVFE